MGAASRDALDAELQLANRETEVILNRDQRPDALFEPDCSQLFLVPSGWSANWCMGQMLINPLTMN